MPNNELLIAGGHVVTGDPELGDLPEADLLIRNGRIAAIGTDLADSGATEVIHAQGRMVLPGLVDAHRHVWQGALGGYTGRHSLLGYVATVVREIAPRYTPQDIYAGRVLAQAIVQQMKKSDAYQVDFAAAKAED